MDVVEYWKPVLVYFSHTSLLTPPEDDKDTLTSDEEGAIVWQIEWPHSDLNFSSESSELLAPN